MAWIESHQQVLSHPKTLNLMTAMGWDLDTTIGKLHRFWWWCVDYAEDGDLRRYNDAMLAAAIALNPDDGQKFVEAMVNCGGEAASGFIDRSPYFRVHDWWRYAGMLLQIRYKHDAKKWEKIRSLYDGKHKNVSKNGSKNHTPTNQTNQTNQPKPETTDAPKNGTSDPPLNQGEKAKPKPLTDVQQVVLWFKVKMGIPESDKAWDKAYFPRYSAPAKMILGLFEGNVDRAFDCVEAVAGGLDRKGLSWTPETVAKHAGDWKHGRFLK